MSPTLEATGPEVQGPGELVGDDGEGREPASEARQRGGGHIQLAPGSSSPP